MRPHVLRPNKKNLLVNMFLAVFGLSSTLPVFAQIDFATLNQATGNTIVSSPDKSFLAQVVSILFPVLIVLAGLLLLLMLIRGGFTMLSNPSNPDAQAGGKQRITWAVVGFLLLFASYWLMQILQVVFGIRVVS